MAPNSDHDILKVLDAVGTRLSELTGWRPAPVEPAPEGGVTLTGPAFVYRWKDGTEPVQVSFWARNEVSIAKTDGHMLAIEPGLGAIRLMLPGHEATVIGAVEPAIYQQIGELTDEAQAHGAGDHWSGDFILIASAMRLLTLTRAAAAAVGPSGKGAKQSPRKEQIVSLLHEWLRPNLAKSVRLAEAAARFNKSPRQLIRILKETTGTGFAEHLTMHRLTLSRALLMRSGQSIMEVARASGFNTREQFIRSFSKAFGWTPLQFRKAWNQAAMGDYDLVELCQVADRTPVEWLPESIIAASPAEDRAGQPHTVVVANALQEIAELFWISPQGKRARIDVLERGGMVFVNRDTGGSCWLVRIPSSGEERCFRTPDDHALAILTAKGDR